MQEAIIVQTMDGHVQEVSVRNERTGETVFNSNDCLTMEATFSLDWSGPKYLYLKIPVARIDAHTLEGEIPNKEEQNGA